EVDVCAAAVDYHGASKLACRGARSTDERTRVAVTRGVGGRRARRLAEAVRRYQTAARRRGGRAGEIGIRAEISGRVGRTHLVGVAGIRGKTCIGEAGRRWRSDLREGGAAAAGAALHAISGDADVVAGGGPAQIDLRAACRSCGQGCWRS